MSIFFECWSKDEIKFVFIGENKNYLKKGKGRQNTHIGTNEHATLLLHTPGCDTKGDGFGATDVHLPS